MTTLAETLRNEIRRLARKEIRQEFAAAKKQTAEHRRVIAQLKREVSELKRSIRFLEKSEKTRVASPGAKPVPEGTRFSAKGLRSHRQRLGLSAADFGRLVGASALTVYNWETGKTRPRSEKLAALVDARKLGKREATRRLELIGE